MVSNVDGQLYVWDERISRAEEAVQSAFARIDRISETNQIKVIQAFQAFKVSDFHFSGSTGYGYNDSGRETLENVYSHIFKTEAALVRPHFASGTHTIACALFGNVRPGERLLFIGGEPYDTLQKVIGKGNSHTGSLREWGIIVDIIPLLEDGHLDWPKIEAYFAEHHVKMVAIQRSRGYSLRPSLTIEVIRGITARVKQLQSDTIIFCDNCYGEFCETLEPTQVGVDLVAGSLIKNPGGGLAPTGGYIAGKAELVEQSAYRLTAPGIGGDVGATMNQMRLFFQGLFLAPVLVGQAIKGSILASRVFADLGISTSPAWDDVRTDLIQAIHFGDEHKLIKFVQSVQYSAPVDSHVRPEPWAMPGYEHPVIMAAGTFIQGGSLEMSADAPIRTPYVAFMQGGLTYSHVKWAISKALITITG